MSVFDAVFTSGFVSSSSTQWYGQNTILTTFIFEQKQTPLKPYALIPIVGRNPATGDVLIIAQRRGRHTETQYLTWFGKTAYIHGRELFHYRQRKDYIHTWRRINTPLPSLTAAHGSSSFSSTLCTSHVTQSHNSHILLSLYAFFIGINGKARGHQLWDKWW